MTLQGPIWLGLDAGGTACRWVAVDVHRTVVAQGQVGGFSGLNLGSAAQRTTLDQALRDLAAGLATGLAADAADSANSADAVSHAGAPDDSRRHLAGVYAGITGVSESESAMARELAALLAQALQVRADRVQCHSDMDIAFRAAQEPGQGYLIYAGTGSIATFFDAEGTWHRAGGRGFVLGDEGGGYWIAREALSAIWRREDELPGQWVNSPMARCIFSRLGGADWALTRQFVYGRERGEVGRLALAVAEAAEFGDAEAAALLRRAGIELGRLAAVLHRRFGPRPVVAAGRVLLLHPLVAQGLRAALPSDCPLEVRQIEPALAAAQRARTLWGSALNPAPSPVLTPPPGQDPGGDAA